MPVSKIDLIDKDIEHCTIGLQNIHYFQAYMNFMKTDHVQAPEQL